MRLHMVEADLDGTALARILGRCTARYGDGGEGVTFK